MNKLPPGYELTAAVVLWLCFAVLFSLFSVIYMSVLQVKPWKVEKKIYLSLHSNVYVVAKEHLINC